MKMRVDELKNPREVLRSNDGGKPEFAPEICCSSSGLRGLAVLCYFSLFLLPSPRP